MPLIWLTGVPGAGKSTVRRELLRRGHVAYDADEDGFRVWRHRHSGDFVNDPGRGRRPPDWHEEHWFPIVRKRVMDLAGPVRDSNVFLAGSVPNEDEVWDLFDLAICLVVDDGTLTHRLATRTDNDFAKTAAVRNAVLGWNPHSEATYRGFGATIIDGTRPLPAVVDDVLAAVERADRTT